MSFRDILLRAKLGDETAKVMLLEQYKPMLIKGSIINGRFDEDLYQEQCMVLMKCINLFNI
ncbi:MAG: helix-turn-helix domain-containing protein [Oscillospiraceae bacterium]|nr:helix-turn-helix domain-containing protein [Oscillospiraceae bacterium]